MNAQYDTIPSSKVSCKSCGCSMLISMLFFFFFQAEDGIRDLTVTGVQTCALPILLRRRAADVRRGGERGQRSDARRVRRDQSGAGSCQAGAAGRSESGPVPGFGDRKSVV